MLTLQHRLRPKTRGRRECPVTILKHFSELIVLVVRLPDETKKKKKKRKREDTSDVEPGMLIMPPCQTC